MTGATCRWRLDWTGPSCTLRTLAGCSIRAPALRSVSSEPPPPWPARRVVRDSVIRWTHKRAFERQAGILATCLVLFAHAHHSNDNSKQMAAWGGEPAIKSMSCLRIKFNSRRLLLSPTSNCSACRWSRSTASSICLSTTTCCYLCNCNFNCPER